MGSKLQRYLWPKTVLLFYTADERIEAAFGYLEKDGVKVAERRSFALQERDALVAWYREIRRTYPRTYVASMLDTINQGAVPGCSRADLEKFGVDASVVTTLCVDDNWSVYTSVVEMKWFEQKFKGMEFDFLYSPFVLLYRRSRSLLEEKPALFLLHTKGTLFAAVLSVDRLWYAHVAVVSEGAREESDFGAADEEAEGEELGGFDLEMIDEDTDISEIEGGAMLEDLDAEAAPLEEDESALERLEYTLNLFEELKSLIERYYHDARYPQTFIEKVTVFDIDALDSDFARYVEEELFMETTMLAFDPIDTMAQLVESEGV